MANRKVKCCYCKTYTDRATAYNHGIVNFCDKEHFLLWNNKDSSPSEGIDKPKKRKKPKGPADDPTPWTKILVDQRDHHQCSMCHRTTQLERHHIFYRSETRGKPWRHEMSNLILLCQEHHGVVHSDKTRYQRLCLGVVWQRSMGHRTTIQKVEEYDRHN